MAKALAVSSVEIEPGPIAVSARTDPGSVPGLVPSEPDPALLTLIFTGLRAMVTVGSTVGILHGVYSDSMLTMLASSMGLLGGVIWSFWEKVVAARARHQAAVVSARAGEPVEPLPKPLRAPPRAFTTADLHVIADRFIAATPPAPPPVGLSESDVERIAARLAEHLHPTP